MQYSVPFLSCVHKSDWSLRQDIDIAVFCEFINLVVATSFWLYVSAAIPLHVTFSGGQCITQNMVIMRWLMLKPCALVYRDHKTRSSAKYCIITRLFFELWRRK